MSHLELLQSRHATPQRRAIIPLSIVAATAYLAGDIVAKISKNGKPPRKCLPTDISVTCSSMLLEIGDAVFVVAIPYPRQFGRIASLFNVGWRNGRTDSLTIKQESFSRFIKHRLGDLLLQTSGYGNSLTCSFPTEATQLNHMQ